LSRRDIRERADRFVLWVEQIDGPRRGDYGEEESAPAAGRGTVARLADATPAESDLQSED
jgi:hypothetical protein